MSEKVFLRLDDSGESLTSQWCICSGEGALHSGSGSLEQAGQALGGRGATVLVPGTRVLLTHTTIPERQRRHLLKAVPYLLEDKLADEIETLHFAVGQRDEEGEVRVAVTSLQTMQQCLQQLDAAGVVVRELVPDTLAVPCFEGAWTLLLGGQTAWLRQDEHHSYAVDIEQAAEFLTIALSQASEPPAAVQLLDNDAISEFHKYEIKCICDEMNIPLREETYEDLQQLFARQYAIEKNAINLLQGAFSRREELERHWRPWRAAAIIALALLGLQMTNLFLEQHQLEQQRVTLEKKIESVYRTAFPSAKRVVDPMVQMEQQLRLLRAGSQGQQFSRLFSMTVDALRQVRGLQLQLVNYRNDELEVVLHAPNLQILDQFKQLLTQEQRLAVDISSANTTGERVEGRLQIREAK
jgi:general secretion pathway protein L